MNKREELINTMDSAQHPAGGIFEFNIVNTTRVPVQRSVERDAKKNFPKSSDRVII